MIKAMAMDVGHGLLVKAVGEMTIKNVFAPLTAPTATNSSLDTALAAAGHFEDDSSNSA
jgi:hypothetical protein